MDYYVELGLPATELTPQGIEFRGKISFMKAGLVHSRKITTVSPAYAREIRTPEFGCGLDEVLRERGDDLTGILNGVDYAVWNPDDPVSGRSYNLNNIQGKKECKLALQSELGLSPHATGPLFAVVSRLTSQKGMDLLLAALPDFIKAGVQLAVLGTGTAPWKAAFGMPH